jgi:hypothetical protein
MAKKPNYQYEKRQRELAKKRKKEEKIQAKLNKSQAPTDVENGSVSAETSSEDSTT